MFSLHLVLPNVNQPFWLLQAKHLCLVIARALVLERRSCPVVANAIDVHKQSRQAVIKGEQIQKMLHLMVCLI